MDGHGYWCVRSVKDWVGSCVSVIPPLVLWFAVRHSERTVVPLVLIVAGGILITGPAFYLLTIPRALEKTSAGKSRLWSLTSEALHSDPVHEWVESRAYFLQVGAIPIVACAWIWLLVRAFRTRRAWGWASLFYRLPGSRSSLDIPDGELHRSLC